MTHTNTLTTTLALLITVLLCSCEKLDINSEEATSTSTASVTLHITTIAQQPFAQQTRADNALADLCTRLNIVAIDAEGKKVVSVAQKAGDDTFGTATLDLPEGDYQLVVVGHSCTANATITSAEEIAFPNNKLTDTFSACQSVHIGTSTDHKDLSVALSRRVAMIRLVMTDATLPNDFATLELYYTGGSSTLNALTGFGAKNSRQTEVRQVAEAHTNSNGNTVFEVYTIPHEENDLINFKATAKDAAGNTLLVKEVESLPVTLNTITQWQGEFFATTSPSDCALTVAINAAWANTTTIEF